MDSSIKADVNMTIIFVDDNVRWAWVDTSMIMHGKHCFSLKN